MTCYLNFEDIALGLSVHAYKRRTQRGIQQQHIAHLLRFGRKQFHRHAIYYSIGHKEINKYADLCPMLKNMNGMHLVTATNGKVLTMFRNRDTSACSKNKNRKTMDFVLYPLIIYILFSC